MTATARDKFFTYLDGMATEIRSKTPKHYFRAAMATSLCIHFWPELTRVQAETIVDAWINNCDAPELGLSHRPSNEDRRSGKDRRRMKSERKLLFSLRVLKYRPERRSGVDRRRRNKRRMHQQGHSTLRWLNHRFFKVHRQASLHQCDGCPAVQVRINQRLTSCPYL